MTSERNSGPEEASASTADRLVDAARECLLAVGWRRTTLTDVARRAGVSRMTVYRNYPDIESLFADLMTREWLEILDEVAGTGVGNRWPERIASRVGLVLAALRTNPLVARLVDVDPELLLPYLLHRRGRSQQAVLDVVAAAIADGQQAGEIRDGEPQLLARSLLLAAQGFFLSPQTMVEDGLTVEAFDTQLTELVRRYLEP